MIFLMKGLKWEYYIPLVKKFITISTQITLLEAKLQNTVHIMYRLILHFMSSAAALFLEMWKRYSAEITHRWDLTGFDIQEEHPRPQYLARLAHIKKKTVNIVTKTVEPKPPFWKMRFPGIMISLSSVVLLVRAFRCSCCEDK